MSNEKKLKRLLQVAVKNGWEDKLNLIFGIGLGSLSVTNIAICDSNYTFNVKLSLNDLVTNFEEGEVSFIEALITAVTNKLEDKSLSYIRLALNLKWQDTLCAESGWDNENYNVNIDKINLVELIRIKWNLKPTSQRLQWLFKTFNHLFV